MSFFTTLIVNLLLMRTSRIFSSSLAQARTEALNGDTVLLDGLMTQYKEILTLCPEIVDFPFANKIRRLARVKDEVHKILE